MKFCFDLLSRTVSFDFLLFINCLELIQFILIISYFRPDLVDWRSLKNSGIRDRLDSAFDVMEREYGVTRLLDPEGNIYSPQTTIPFA